MLKYMYDWLKIVEMPLFAKSLEVAAFIMVDMPVSWTFLNQDLLKVNVHGKPVNCNRIPLSSVCRKEIHCCCCEKWPAQWILNERMATRYLFLTKLFVSMLTAVVFHNPGSISNFSSTRIQVLKRC